MLVDEVVKDIVLSDFDFWIDFECIVVNVLMFYCEYLGDMFEFNVVELFMLMLDFVKC